MSNQFPWKTTSVVDGVMEGENDKEWGDFIISLQSTLGTMIRSGLTDGWNDAEILNGKTIVHRYWATEEAAQMWADLVTSKPLKNGLVPTCTIYNLPTP